MEKGAPDVATPKGGSLGQHQTFVYKDVNLGRRILILVLEVRVTGQLGQGRLYWPRVRYDQRLCTAVKSLWEKRMVVAQEYV